MLTALPCSAAHKLLLHFISSAMGVFSCAWGLTMSIPLLTFPLKCFRPCELTEEFSPLTKAILFWLLRYPKYAAFAWFSVHSCSVISEWSHRMKEAGCTHKLRFPCYRGACSPSDGQPPLISPSAALFLSFAGTHPFKEWQQWVPGAADASA